MATEHPQESEDSKKFLLKTTADIFSSYVQANRLDPDQIDLTIRKIYQTLISLKNDEIGCAGLVPAVPIEESVTPDYLVCLEEGKKFKLLKRHLRTNHDMAPDEYREKWGLPPDYPMVAPNYAKKRRRLAKENGLGLKEASE